MRSGFILVNKDQKSSTSTFSNSIFGPDFIAEDLEDMPLRKEQICCKYCFSSFPNKSKLTLHEKSHNDPTLTVEENREVLILKALRKLQLTYQKLVRKGDNSAATGLDTNSTFFCFLFCKKIIGLPGGQINDP